MDKRTLKILIPILLALIGLYFTEQKAPIRPTPTPTQLPTATSSVASAAASQREILVDSPVIRTYAVTKVVDGDTIAVLMDGKKVTIRLIGMDTPETVDPRKPVQCFGIEASDKAKELLTGQAVEIEQDDSQDTYDKYGRLLAYVYLPDLSTPLGASGISFNEYMIAGPIYSLTLLTSSLIRFIRSPVRLDL